MTAPTTPGTRRSASTDEPAPPVRARRGVRALLLAAALLAVAAAALWRVNPMVEGAERYAASVAVSAGGVYLTLRSLNAFLSTAQEVEVGGSFVVSGTVQPLKALEPVDDTIERVASLVFFVMVATGILSVAMGPASALGFAMLGLGLALIAWRGAWPGGAARRLGWYGGFLALAVPMAFLASDLLAERMTQDALARHEAVVARITAPVDAPVPQAGDPGWTDSVRVLWDEVERYQALAAGIYAEADALVVSLIGILSVFVFRLLVLPGLILGGVYAAVRMLAAGR